MKKLFTFILCLCLVSVSVAGLRNASADEISVEIDGKEIVFDINPEIIDGRTMVPLRKIFEEIGAFVKWDEDTRTVSARKNSKTVTLVIDSADMQIDKGKTDDNGNPVTETVVLEVPAQIMSGRTLVPARAVSESFGLNVDWNERERKVVITSDNDEDESWKENTASVNLSDKTYDGNGIEIDGNQIKITAGGDYTLTGTLDDGNIIISAKEKVKLRLNGAKITSSNNPCIFVEKADKAYITLSDGTENYLTAENSEDGAIYSKENLEIKGDGSLSIDSKAGHGIKASDNLNIEKGTITINATSDGIHINDTFKMSGGKIDITAVGDGIDSESIVNISGGEINIETNGTPVETTPVAEENTQANPRRFMWEDEADVEFEKSSKGINAEWMMRISGGEITADSASHAVHCGDEIEINGGIFNLSSKYDKGISAHGNLTINGQETVINVTKSTEGIESKNVMTVNDGVINVVSTDDAINATGGNSGMMMMPGGNFGGNGAGGERVSPWGERRDKNAPSDGQIPQGGERVSPWGEGRDKNVPSDGQIPQGGERVSPWGEGRDKNIPSDGQVPQGREPRPGRGNMPQREANGEAGNMNPGFMMPQGGEFTPPQGMPNGGGFQPPEGFAMPPEFEAPNGDGMRPGGFMGARANMKTCLVINGGYFELCGEDDCVDANGNMVINGGTIKATNPTGAFTGNFGVLDSDGQITVSDNANIILASSSGSERGLTLSQNTIVVYFETQHEAGEEIKISDSKGQTVLEYAPDGQFKAVLIATADFKTGEKYSITAGNEKFETEITQKSTVVGTPSGGGMGFGRGQRINQSFTGDK